MADNCAVVPGTLRDFRDLLAAIVACEAAGGVGAIATTQSVNTWYPTLCKPSFNPPPTVFGPVWAALYALMGTSVYLIGRSDPEKAASVRAYTLFGVQLALNSLWSFIFFKFRSPRYAFLEIIVLWVAIAMTAAACFRISKLAGLLLLPYLLWTSFAAVLNFSIWRLNR